MPIRFACPNCQTVYTAEDRDAGKKSACKSCGQRLQVPAPPRSKTILGELLPPAPRPTGAEPAARRPAPDPIPLRPARPGQPAAAGPIRFDCPACRTSYTVNRASAGKPMDCRACGRPMVVPGDPGIPAPPRPSPEPAPLPVTRQVADDYGPVPDEPGYPPAPDLPPYLATRHPARTPNGPVNRLVAGAGAALVFVALFLPMVTGPFGFWMAFIDVPWKAATVGFAVVDEIQKERPPDPAPRSDRRPDDRAGRAEDGRAGRAGLAVLVAIGGVLYPLVVLGAAGFAALQVAAGRTARGYFVAGLVVGGATVMYAVGLLLLNAVPEMRLALLVVSPGYGWAVMLVGSVALLAAGAIRLERDG